jgi:hypothetical protein
MVRAVKKRAVLSDSDLMLLRFLWKWRVSTTSALAARFYPHKNLRRAYNRLLVLEKAGIIQSRADIRGERFLWTLTKEGYRRIRHLLPIELEQEGFDSKALGHDLLCAAVLAGDWFLVRTPPDLVRVTEQELSRYKKEDYPISVPFGHRADGYWYFKTKQKIVALEVQLSRQKLKDYEDVGRYYGDHENVETILWVVDRISMSNAILKGIRGRFGQPTEKHNFVSFGNFFKNGYDAAIEVGKLQGVSIHQLLSAHLPAVFPPAAEKAVRKLLDVRKSPHIAKNERYYAPGDHW